jgi:hypothetical protein
MVAPCGPDRQQEGTQSPALRHTPSESYCTQKSTLDPFGSCIRRLMRETYFFPTRPYVMIPVSAIHPTGPSFVPAVP